ncbi:GT-D fold domain-containing glycosyltransferase [Isoptericola jiangsuensis]|nr:GT-D fold domain-containing glycosyltransferase [Isoptericola jiangsuensis]
MGSFRLPGARVAGEALAELRRLREAAETQVTVSRRTARRVAELERQVADLTAQLSVRLDRIGADVAATRKDAESGRKELTTLRTAATASTMSEVLEFTAQRQMTLRETLELLARERTSFARFGDGELRMMVDPLYDLGFQKNSAEIRAALRETLAAEPVDGLLVGWPQTFRTAHNSGVWELVWQDVRRVVPEGRRFGNSHVSRPICFLELGDDAVRLWRDVWADEKVLVVTGRGSRFDLVPALFDDVAAVDHLWTVPRHAFEVLDELEAEIVARASDELVLLALGPAGTILASRLARAGVWAIDVGHLSNSYLNVVDGAPKPEKTPAVRRAARRS